MSLTTHGCPKVETLRCGIEYAFTWNPKDSHGALHEGYPAYRAYMIRQSRLFSKLHSVSVKLLIEASPKGRLHSHGYLKINNLHSFLLIDMPVLQKHGMYEIDTLGEDPLVWHNYVHKQQHVWEPYARSHGVSYVYESETYDI